MEMNGKSLLLKTELRVFFNCFISFFGFCQLLKAQNILHQSYHIFTWSSTIDCIVDKGKMPNEPKDDSTPWRGGRILFSNVAHTTQTILALPNLPSKAASMTNMHSTLLHIRGILIWCWWHSLDALPYPTTCSFWLFLKRKILKFFQWQNRFTSLGINHAKDPPMQNKGVSFLVNNEAFFDDEGMPTFIWFYVISLHGYSLIIILEMMRGWSCH